MRRFLFICKLDICRNVPVLIDANSFTASFEGFHELGIPICSAFEFGPRKKMVGAWPDRAGAGAAEPGTLPADPEAREHA